MNSEITFVDRLRLVIGDEDYTPWAQKHGISPVTVLGWLNGASLYPKSWEKLINATGIEKDWWLNGVGDPPLNEKSKVKNTFGDFPYGMMDKREQKVEQLNSDYKNNDDHVLIDYYVDVKGSAGPGQLIDNDAEEIVLKVRMDARLLRERAGNDFKRLKMAGVTGDSMLPTLSHGDQVVIDTQINKFIDDAIYAILQDGFLRYKRVQKRLDGNVIVKSDNPSYGDPEIYTQEEASYFHIVGMVIPFKFGRFKI